jgi:hypothetical protein
MFPSSNFGHPLQIGVVFWSPPFAIRRIFRAGRGPPSLSVATVRKHLEHIYAKLDVRNRTAAAARAFPQGPGNGTRSG